MTVRVECLFTNIKFRTWKFRVCAQKKSGNLLNKMGVSKKTRVLNAIALGASVLILNHLRKRQKNRTRPSQRVNPYLKERNPKGRFCSDVSDIITKI